MRYPIFSSCAAGAALACLIGGVTAARPLASDRIVAPGIISTGAAEVRIAYRPDGRQILWGSIGRDADSGQQDIWEMHRLPAGGWSKPAPVSFDTKAVEFDPAFSADSRRLYFDSDRPGGLGGTDIYVVDVDLRTHRFSAPRNLGPVINSRGDEWAATPTPDGKIIFASDGWGGAGKHDLLEGDARSARPPRNLGSAINGPDEDFDAAISPDGKTLVFSSGVMDDETNRVALFRARRIPGGWSARQPLGLACADFAIGAAFAVRQPGRLYYSANCPGGRGRTDIHETRLPG